MDRRSFVMALFGGLAAASVGGIAASEAAQPKLGPTPVPTPTPEPEMAPEEIDADTKAALDKTDTDFSQYYYYRRPVYRRRVYYRPVYRRPVYYYRRPRRVYYYRRRYW